MGKDSDVALVGRAMRESRRQRGVRNLAAANPEGWTRHTEWHWSRSLNGSRLDYWPSRNRWQYGGRVMTGNIDAFIRKRTSA